jgi:hypothetical protein
MTSALGRIIGVRTVSGTEMSVAAEARPVRPSLNLGMAFDVITVAVLGSVAWAARWGSLPSDGLWFDDSWVAAGAILGDPGDLLTVGSSHPGFTAILMVVDRLGGGDLAYLGVPSLVFGAVTPPALYLGLRSFGYERPISALLGGALAVAPVPILYAGRVKGYTLDTLVVLLIVVVIPLLARRTWRWPLAAAWTVGAIAVGTFSGYALVATAAAGLILVLHPAGDRVVRLVAVGVQAVVQAVYFVVLRSKSDADGIEEVLEQAYDAHMSFSWNPLTFGREVLEHLRRLAEVFPADPGGNTWWLSLLALLSMSGLVLAATRGFRRSETVAGRYLLLLVVTAAVGSLFERFPFGPHNEGTLSLGGRHALWMVPALAFGLAAVAHRAGRWAARRDPLRLGFGAILIGAAVGIMVVGYQPAPGAPFPGSESGARFVDAAIGRDDVVIVTNASVFAYAISTTTPVGVTETPDHQVGFAPVYLDPSIKSIGVFAAEPASPEEILAWTADADRVFVLANGPLYHGLKVMRSQLVPAGFRLAESRQLLWSVVDIYHR